MVNDHTSKCCRDSGGFTKSVSLRKSETGICSGKFTKTKSYRHPKEGSVNLPKALNPIDTRKEVAAQAKEKQEREGRELGGKPTLSVNLPKGSTPIDTRKEVAAQAKVSEKTYAKGKEVKDTQIQSSTFAGCTIYPSIVY